MTDWGLKTILMSLGSDMDSGSFAYIPQSVIRACLDFGIIGEWILFGF